MQTRDRSSGRWLWPALLAISMAIFGLGLWRAGGSLGWSFGRASRLTHGSVIEDFTVRDAERGDVTIRAGRWHFLMIGRPAEDAEVIRYLETLLDSGHFKPGAIDAVVFAKATSTAIAAFKQENRSGLPMVSVHEYGAIIRSALRLEGHDRIYLLVDPSQRVVFLADFMKKGDLRQLLEKHLPVDTPLSPARRPLAVGDEFPTIPFVSLEDGSTGSTRGGSQVWIVFTAKCTSCALNTSLDLYGAVQSLVQARSKKVGPPTILFSKHFDRDMVRAKVKALKIGTPARLATGELEGIEDPYLQEPYGPEDVLVVAVDGKNKIVRIQSISRFIKQLTEDTHDSTITR